METKVVHKIERLVNVDECYKSTMFITQDSTVLETVGYSMTYGTQAYASLKNLQLLVRKLHGLSITDIVLETNCTRLAEELTTLCNVKPETLKHRVIDEMYKSNVKINAVKLA